MLLYSTSNLWKHLTVGLRNKLLILNALEDNTINRNMLWKRNVEENAWQLNGGVMKSGDVLLCTKWISAKFLRIDDLEGLTEIRRAKATWRGIDRSATHLGQLAEAWMKGSQCITRVKRVQVACQQIINIVTWKVDSQNKVFNKKYICLHDSVTSQISYTRNNIVDSNHHLSVSQMLTFSLVNLGKHSSQPRVFPYNTKPVMGSMYYPQYNWAGWLATTVSEEQNKVRRKTWKIYTY